jgi:hypothetical protein
MRQRGRWLVVLGVLAAGWLASPVGVPLYDGVGFPDEPYRFVPARDATAPAATTAQARLRLVGGLNTGLLVNSGEVGPQVTFYAPPHAFEVGGAPAGAEVVLRVQPVPLSGPAPSGVLASNVYAVSATSAAGPVTVRTDAQSPAITLRATTAVQPLPVVRYRSSPTAPWQQLRTRPTGRDVVNADAPGLGEYVLTRPVTRTAADTGAGRGPLLLVIGLAALLVVGVLVGVRLLGRQRE